MTNTAGPPASPKAGQKGLRTVDPAVIDERAFMNAIRNGSLASPKLARSSVKSTTIWRLFRTGRFDEGRSQVPRSIGSDTQGKYSVPAEGYETESLLAAKRHRGRARRTFVRF